MFQVLVELTLIVLSLLILGTQVIIPMVKGGPYFPFLRRDLKKAEEDLREAQAEVETATIEVETKATVEKATALRKTVEPVPVAKTKPKRKTTRRRM